MRKEFYKIFLLDTFLIGVFWYFKDWELIYPIQVVGNRNCNFSIRIRRNMGFMGLKLKIIADLTQLAYFEIMRIKIFVHANLIQLKCSFLCRP